MKLTKILGKLERGISASRALCYGWTFVSGYAFGQGVAKFGEGKIGEGATWALASAIAGANAYIRRNRTPEIQKKDPYKTDVDEVFPGDPRDYRIALLLRHHGIYNIGQLLEKSEAELRKMGKDEEARFRFGDKTIERIRDRLWWHGPWNKPGSED